MRIVALLLAGGSSHRFGGMLPKQLVVLAGEPIIVRSARLLEAARPERLVVVSGGEWLSRTAETLERARLDLAIAIAAGGSSRQASARLGIDALRADDDDIVVIHDAARPL